MQRGLCLLLKCSGPDPGEDFCRRQACETLHRTRQTCPDRLAILHDASLHELEARRWFDPWIRDFPGAASYIAFQGGGPANLLNHAAHELFSVAPAAGWLIAGSDFTDVEPALLHEAWDCLDKGCGDHLVIGPATGGGSYLIGMKKIVTAGFGRSSILSFRDCLFLPEKSNIGSMEESRPFVKNLNPRPCVFFDRDGVVNESPGEGYVLNRKDFRLNPGIVESLRTVAEAGAYAIVVTSQKGVGKELMSAADLEEIHRGLQEELARSGVTFDAIYTHTGLPDSHPPKPDPGMMIAAAQDFPNIDLSRSWVIGDADRDIAMGRNAGLRGAIRIRGEKAISIEADFTLDSTLELPKLLSKLL